MTKQEYYDLLVRMSAEGGFPSIEDGRCAYRGDGGRKCAAGWLIPDDEYDYEMEGEGLANGILAREVVRDHLPDGMKLPDVIDCQERHDRIADPYGRYGHKGKWDHPAFVRSLNALTCFNDVNKMEPEGAV